MCEARCSYGRGGNLCNCNAFHFAGKRAGAAYSSRQSLLDLQDDDLMGLSAVKGGESGAGSGNSESYPPRGVGRSSGHRDGANNGDVVVEGFIGVEGSQRSAVHRLASLLKDAIDERLCRWRGVKP
nr:hypothetical protein BaRGS_008515 [Batillaria attramentaria]